jgi:hypothetical protein
MACADCGHGRFREEMGMQSCFGCMRTMTERLRGWLWDLRNRPPKVNMPKKGRANYGR